MSRRATASRGAAPVFAALGDPTRLAVVARLSARGPLSITEITDGAGVSRQAISKHLRILAHAGVVRGKRQGRQQIWQLEAERLGSARKWLKQLSRGWDDTLERLRTLVEKP
jgi:DNA-binding transcriptional ArsR family regulator